MSSTSFVEYLIAGTTSTKFGQNGRNPRPAGPWNFMFILCQCVSIHKSKPIQLDVIQDLYSKTKRPEPRMIGSTCSTPTQPQAWNRLWEEYATIDQHVGGSEDREVTSLGQAAQPPTDSLQTNATATDIFKRSEPLAGKAVTRGRHP